MTFIFFILYINSIYLKPLKNDFLMIDTLICDAPFFSQVNEDTTYAKIGI